MKDSFNYASFSNALFVRRGNRKPNQKRSVIIEADELSLSQDYQVKYYPPYLCQDTTIKTPCKK